jgi:hypothetical protein
MSKVRNVSGGPRYVPLLDREVADGETVDVPDVQADGVSPVVWPEATWEPVPDKPAKTSAKADAPPAADTSGKAAV